jgi:hypothetical protein
MQSPSFGTRKPKTEYLGSQGAEGRKWKSVTTKMIGTILVVSAACSHVLLITICSSTAVSLFCVLLGTGKEHWSRQKVTLNAASKAMLIKWTRMARSEIQKRGGDARNASRGQRKNIEAVRSKRKTPGKKAPSGKKSKMRRK